MMAGVIFYSIEHALGRLHFSWGHKCCRKCSTSFTYQLPTGGHVSISVGIPTPHTPYKAIFHVWGTHCGVQMNCTNCYATYSPRLRSPSSFRHLMSGAGAGSTVWLDNLSINQEDPADVAAQSPSWEIYTAMPNEYLCFCRHRTRMRICGFKSF